MYQISIKDKEDVSHIFYLKFGGLFKIKKIKVEGVCGIYLSKFHNHRYDIKAYFYQTDYIYFRACIGTLKELYNVVQKLLQENLYGAIQKK